MHNIRKIYPKGRIVYGSGDNYNDIDMLEYAGLEIAMGNAPDDVKKYANDVTLANDEDGVAEALEKYVILCKDGSKNE